MINDFKKDHHYSIFEELPLIKNISYEMDSGKYVLLDNKGNNYTCDIFGRIKPVFKKNISGFINGNQRKVLKRVKSQPNIINAYNTQNVFNKKEKEEEKSYFPSINRFEGYTHFPRPLCPPFTNIPQYVLDESYKKLLNNKCKDKLVVDENKKVFIKSNENKGLSYITSDIKGYFDKKNEKENGSNYLRNNNIPKKDDKLLIIKMIDNTVDDYKIKYKCDLNELINKHSIIRPLLNLKENLINNNETNIINSRKLKGPIFHIINDYKIIHNKIFNFDEKTRKRNEHKRLMKCYSQMNIKKIKNNDSNYTNDNKNIYGRKILNKISSYKNLSNKKHVISAIKKDEEITKDLFVNMNKDKINENKEDNKSITINNKSLMYINTNQNIYDEQETKESLGTKANINLINIRNNTNESNKEENLSILSVLNEKETNKFIKFNKKIKYLKTLKKQSEKERKHLEGYQKEEPTKPKEFDMIEEEPPKYRDFSEIYKKELETLEKLNPILFNLQKKKDDYDMKKMKQKKHFKKLNEKLITKGKTLKINKSSSD